MLFFFSILFWEITNDSPPPPPIVFDSLLNVPLGSMAVYSFNMWLQMLQITASSTDLQLCDTNLMTDPSIVLNVIILKNTNQSQPQVDTCASRNTPI